ncbi:HNH endonuclease [Celeribacter naphthalenivorans]|uniref:HNH endonuclease n=1 Tax=Celeribacter naphthalenivorans TaxID=1614694 RepID=UPI001CFBC997|nr:HNH endonuclease [Celeribacter naphthalenivorans]
MRNLPQPPFGATELFDESVNGLTDDALREKFENNRDKVVSAFNDFAAKTAAVSWCALPRWGRGHDEAKVAGELTKGDLVNLYDSGVVKSKARPRDIYDAIKLAAHDECPYCGGVGDIGFDGELGTADHFLPKSRFPVYSVLPLNLVPACSVCNKGMGDNFPTEREKQPLHPYLDSPHFFNVKWTSAQIVEDLPVMANFSVVPPEDWSEIDKARVKAHFDDCSLASRYRSRVSSEVTPLISQRKSSLSWLSAEKFKAHLQTVADESSLPINGWKRTLYAALAASDWFCSRERLVDKEEEVLFVP